jgi:hypothetical protein
MPAVLLGAEDKRLVWRTRSWQSAGQGFAFIRSTSATPLVLGALNSEDRSSVSSLTSTNASLLTSRRPEKRKVAARRTTGRFGQTFLAGT